jgi:(E)-4-hydroxy-3-methylbut-2-enyl-diphosphate synthase
MACEMLARRGAGRVPLLLVDRSAQAEAGDPLLEGATRLGGLLADGIGDAIRVDGGDPREGLSRALGVLQATRLRMTRPDYISCPSCGRTLFDLEEVTARIQSVTSHLVGVKIAIMGCIVNGPGEMADADFGYVGSSPGKVNLYVGKDCVVKNVPADEAPARLVALIKERGRWVEPRIVA